ncbi:unnamed protein product, partial [Meganyctiphanes norvegica]
VFPFITRMLVCRVPCIALTVLGVILVPAVTAESGLGRHQLGSRDCQDVFFAGDHFEGYYAVHNQVNYPGEVDIVYCGVSDGMLPRNTSLPRSNPNNCQDLKDGGMGESGINIIYPWTEHPETPVIAYCEQGVMGGGWTVFQRRDDYPTQLDFYRTFDEYSLGFGSPGAEFWLGNDILHELTKTKVSELYVELTSFADVTKYAMYNSFYVGPRGNTKNYARPYQLSVSHFSGTAGDSLTNHNGMGFTTFDSDNDLSSANCAAAYRVAWWYNKCYTSNLNGFYYDSAIVNTTSANWHSFSGSYESLQTITMMTRPLQYGNQE